MKTAILAEPVRTKPAAVLADAGGRLAAYVALTKPRIAVMVLVTVATGFLLGARGAANPSTLAADPARHRAGRRGGRAPGTSISSGPATARMRRTASRPLPSGRVAPVEAASSARC